MSLTGSMTVTGDSILDGALTLTDAEQVILGSPLFSTGTMTLTGDKIELGKPCRAGGLITIQGTDASPAENIVNGTLNVGNINTGSEVYFNITNYYQYIESQGGGYIGDWNGRSNDFIVPNSAEIRVYSGELYIYGEDVPSPNPLAPIYEIEIWINHDWFHIYINSLIDVDDSVYLWGAGANAEENYSGVVNVTRMAENGEFPNLIIVDVNDIILEMGATPARYLEFDGGTVFDSWGDWFAVGSSQGRGGVMVLEDSYVYMNSSQSISYQFRNNDAQAGITLQNSPSYSTAEMFVSTTDQSVTGFSSGYSAVITNGGISTDGFSDIRNMNQITQGTLAFEGDMLLNGSITTQGDIGVSGYSKMLSPMTVTGSLNINDGAMTGDVTLALTDGYMVTDGEMNIDDGEINILGGVMEMNSTGIYIYDASDTQIIGSITSTGTTEINGNTSITGDIGILGYNNMQGNIDIRAPLLSLDGVMVTDGDMSITNGEISIPSGSMVMNDTGSYITGDTITVTGIVNFNGNATISGNIGISGHNYMQGNVNVGQLSLDGVMVTDGDMNITKGEISITDGSMVMDDTGSNITSTGNTITVTGTVDFNGDGTITGDIEISGHNYMEDTISIEGYLDMNNGLTTGEITLNIDGTMETIGSMTITNGNISIPSVVMVMNDTGSYITGDTIKIKGDSIESLGTTEVNGNTTMQGDFEMGGESYIKGPVSITGSLKINGGTMSGTGTITVSDGYMKTVGNLKISNGVIEVLNGKIVMTSSGTIIGSETSITGGLAVAGTVTNSGLVTMNGNFQLLVPLSITGSMITMGITSMGNLGAINGIMTITGNVIMSGLTIISGNNNVVGSMTVTPTGVAINGLVGLTGLVHTTGGLPAMSSSTVLEVTSGSIMGLPILHVALMANPLALLALGILGIGSVWVVFKGIYMGIKERETVVPRIRRSGESLRNAGSRIRNAAKRFSSEIGKRIKRGE